MLATEQMEVECSAQAVIMKVRELKQEHTVSVTNHFSNLEATAALWINLEKVLEDRPLRYKAFLYTEFLFLFILSMI